MFSSLQNHVSIISNRGFDHCFRRKFYEVVDSVSWEEVQNKALKMVQNGEMTEGVVLAGEAVLQEAQRRKEDPQIISSLENALGLLSSAVQMVNAPPGLRLCDECANMMIAAGSPEAAEDRVRERLKEGFADPELDVTPESLLQDIAGFISNIKQQEEQFQEMAQQLMASGNEEQVEGIQEYGRARATALRNLVSLQSIVEQMATA